MKRVLLLLAFGVLSTTSIGAREKSPHLAAWSARDVEIDNQAWLNCFHDRLHEFEDQANDIPHTVPRVCAFLTPTSNPPLPFVRPIPPKGMPDLYLTPIQAKCIDMKTGDKVKTKAPFIACKVLIAPASAS